MTIHSPPTVQHGVEITVPLNKLKASPRNARKTRHAASDIETLAASIAAKGVLQPPVVEPEKDGKGQETGRYLVTIGEGRRLALCLLAKRRVIGKDAPVRCLLDTENDAFEISLDENVTRFGMHPADQFDAFRELAEGKGWGAEEIAARFGVTAQLVRQRLRLAAVSPVLMTAYRAEELTLDQLMAFAVSEDHTRQEQVFASLSFNRAPSHIRRALTEHEVEAADRRALLIGPEAYLAAGGRIRRDLFAEDRGGWFEDVDLLDTLVAERLTQIADRLMADGWRWAEANLDFPHDHGLRRLYPQPVEPDEATAAQIAELSREQDGLAERYQTGEVDPEEAEARSEAIETELAELLRPTYPDEVKVIAGAFVSLAWDGSVRIDRGFVRRDDEPVVELGSDGEHEEPRAKAAGALSERLVAVLTAHRTGGLRDALAKAPEAALLATVHALVLAAYFPGNERSCLEVRFSAMALGGYAEGFPESIAGASIAARHEAWGARLPQEPDGLWEALAGLSMEDQLALLAHCVSLSVDAVRRPGRSRTALSHADRLAAHLSLDMTTYWQATSSSYFSRVSKAQIVEAVTDGASGEVAATLDGLKKDAMANAAADLLGADGWLPPLLRTAAAGPA